DGIDQRLIEIVLRFEDELLGRAVFPGGRTQVAERDLALAIVEFRHLTELQRIALAGAAGEIVEDSPARGHRRRITVRLGELEFIDRAMGRKLAPRRQRRWPRRAETGQRDRGRREDRAEHAPAEDRHRNLPPRRRLAAQHRDAVRLLQPGTAGTLWVSRAQRSTKWCAADPGPLRSVAVPDQRCTASHSASKTRVNALMASRCTASGTRPCSARARLA